MTTPPRSDQRELRVVGTSLELRAANGTDASPRTASGYAALFNTETNVGGMWRERFLPGAFTTSLQERDVLAVHSHDTGRVVGRMGAGTLTLREDASGLAFENELPDTSDGRDLVVQIGRKDIAGMSFAFVARREEWDETQYPPLRTISQADLYEITYSARPQYPDTTVGLRSLENVRDERRAVKQASPETRMAARRARHAQIERSLKP